jgi:hypothetical protein
MEIKKHPFFKGLPGFTRTDDTLLAHDAERSVYFWWWQFLRLSPVYWYARHASVTPTDPVVAEAYERAGDLSLRWFSQWWAATGSAVFAEAKRPAKVRTVDLEPTNTDAQIELYENSLIVEIPLTIRKATIFKQLKDLLEQQIDGVPRHRGRDLNVVERSNALLRLHTKRFRLRTLEIEYLVLLYRLLYPRTEIWRIGDRLQIAPSLKVRTAERIAFNTGSSPFDKLHSLTGRYLYKAERTLLNVERGSFPNNSKIALPDDYAPFGAKHQKDFKAAVSTDATNTSAWQAWLTGTYLNELKSEVIRRNRLDNEYRMPDSKVRRRLPAFLDGSSDLLA